MADVASRGPEPRSRGAANERPPGRSPSPLSSLDRVVAAKGEGSSRDRQQTPWSSRGLELADCDRCSLRAQRWWQITGGGCGESFWWGLDTGKCFGMVKFAVLEAPSALGDVPEHRGVERAPEALLKRGSPRPFGSAGRPGRRDGLQPDTGSRDADHESARVSDYSAAGRRRGRNARRRRISRHAGRRLFDPARQHARASAARALRVLYIDGDADFFQPAVNPSAVRLRRATWLRDRSWPRHRQPTSKTGGRWCATVTWRCSPSATPTPANVSAATVADGVARCGSRRRPPARRRPSNPRGGGVSHARRRPADGFWIHLDADVFDETIMQAVDGPDPTA